MGVGIHGEPSRRRVPLARADVIADEIVGAILDDLKPNAYGEALLLVNGFGDSPPMELCLIYKATKAQAEKRGARVIGSLVGNYVD
jgi:dihydroxyacetone kinase-like protein